MEEVHYFWVDKEQRSVVRPVQQPYEPSGC
jgi:hypothetical protein